MFMNPDSLDFQRISGTQSSKVVELDVKKEVKISENGADFTEDNEEQWLKQWIHQQGVEQFLGKIIRLPELVLEHTAGRVYLIRTKKRRKFYVVVGYGRPTFYPVKKQLTQPKEILGYHRGNGLITKMKVKHIRLKKERIK